MPTIGGVSHIDLTVTDLDRSETWYSELFGLTRLLDGQNDQHHFASRYLVHPETMLIIGLVAHDQPSGQPFNERSIGLDHLAFSVGSAEELEAWRHRLEQRGIDHSPIVVGEMWDVLVFRDPDDIQLELFFTKPEAASLLTAG